MCHAKPNQPASPVENRSQDLEYLFHIHILTSSRYMQFEKHSELTEKKNLSTILFQPVTSQAGTVHFHSIKFAPRQLQLLSSSHVVLLCFQNGGSGYERRRCLWFTFTFSQLNTSIKNYCTERKTDCLENSNQINCNLCYSWWNLIIVQY